MAKRPLKYLVITIDNEAPLSDCVKKVNLSCNKVDNFSGGKDGRRYRWFSIPIENVEQLLKKKGGR